MGVNINMGRPKKIVTEETVAIDVPNIKFEVENPTIKIKLIDTNAKCPKKVNLTDAGADLFAPNELRIAGKDSKFMDLGFQMEIPTGMVGLIFARSGLASKNGIRPRNCVGVIDCKYRGNVGIMIENNSDSTYHIHSGDRIAQIVIMNVPQVSMVEVKELNVNENRGGGFGHTGV